MPLFHRCSGKKALAGFPSLLAIALITFISYTFLFEFVPFYWPQKTLYAWFTCLSFAWYSVMTLASIFAVLTSDPGYVSE